MSELAFDFPQHSFRYEWQRSFRILSKTTPSLGQRYAHKSQHHSQAGGFADNVSRGIDSGIRGIARAANWIDKRILGAYRSTSFARRRSEYSNSSIYFSQD